MKPNNDLIVIILMTLAVLALGAGSAWAVLGFGPPVPLNSDAATDGSDTDWHPQVTTDGLGHWVALWTGHWAGHSLQLLVSRSTDNGATWSPQAPLSPGTILDVHAMSPPRVVTDGLGNWVAMWSDSIGPGLANMWFSRSTDNGATWTPPTYLGDGGYCALHMATDGAGTFIIVWWNWSVIWFSRSTDGGATWTPPATLASDVNADIFGPCVATDGAGNWVTVWPSQNDLGGPIGTDQDILVARSTNNGVSWTAPAALNANAATDSGIDGFPQVTTDGAGNWVAVWGSEENLGGTIGTDFDILVSRSTDNGVTWSWPEALNANAATDSGDDGWWFEFAITTDGAGNWIVVWPSLDDLGGTIGPDFDILVARSIDNGATWSWPEALNTHAANDTAGGWEYMDIEPQVATGGLGHWVVVWQSNYDLGGTIGTEEDILVSTSTRVGVTAARLWNLYQ